MDEKEILDKITQADKSDLNYFEILGTDQVHDSHESFPEAYFEYRNEWTNRPDRADYGDFPLHVDIESTNRCNLRCSMCQIDFDTMESGVMDMELYRKIIAECGENNLPSIKLNYRGEPTINKNIVEMVRLGKKAGIIEVQFNSNGTLLNDKLSNDLIDAGLDRIKFSIDGATPEVYEKIRGTSYDRVVENVLNLLKIRDEKGKDRPIVYVQMVSMKDNSDEIVKYINFWQDKVNRIGFTRYRSTERKLDDTRRVEKDPVVTVPCPQLWQRLLVTYDGQILMCCGDHKALNPLGNITETTLKKVWNSKQLNEYRMLHLQDRSSEIAACSMCEINRTDAENAEEIWKEIRANVEVQ